MNRLKEKYLKEIVPSLKSKFEASNIITKYNSTVLPKKKQIKYKRLKSSFCSS